MGLRDARSVGPRGRAPRPRRATTYTKTPKSRARTPISMASSRMVRPEQLRGGGSWCSRRLPQLGRRRLARPGARGRRSRPRAGAGGGSRAGAGAVGRNQRHPPSAGPGAPALRPRAQRGAPRGLPAPARRLRALGPRRGPAAREGSPGKPRRLLPARCALPAAGRPLRLPAGPPARAPPSGRPAHARGPVVGARWGFSPAGGSPGAPCLHLPNLKYVLFPRKFPRDHSQAAFCLQEAPARRRSPGTD